METWRLGLIIPNWKGNRSYEDCGNYLGITQFTMPGKVLAYLLLMLIHGHLLKQRTPEQSGFITGKSTTDHIIALCAPQEHHGPGVWGLAKWRSTVCTCVW